ncbi:MAG TPA: hypothetical protein VK671_00255 [Mucilaginibacter sp.]|jgi:hypothetical protein|nr:hypothetical protein [Mucilaginibacter sp.]
MKIILLCILIILCSLKITYAQKTYSKRIVTDSQKGETTALHDTAFLFTWDIQKEAKGSLMFLDVPYGHDGKTEYLSITVAKDTSKDRPAFISVIVPSAINQSNGIFMAFANNAKSVSGEPKLEIAKDHTVRLNFEKCGDTDCAARIINGYWNDKEDNKQVDVLKNFLEYDHVLFLILYNDGGHKSVAVPLFSFKKQYKALP